MAENKENKDWLTPEKRKKEIAEKIFKAGYKELDLERLKKQAGIDIVALLADKDRLDFLQVLTDRKEYTGKVVVRTSTTARGWRMHETSGPYGWKNVREAIDWFMTYEDEDDNQN